MLRRNVHADTHYHTRDLKNLVTICTMDDVVNENGNMVLTRKSAVPTWARVAAVKPSFFGVEGRTVLEPVAKPTHLVVMRSRYEINFTTAAWVYEERRKTSPRWYKVLSFVEDEEFTWLDVRMVERSDMVTTPVGPTAKELIDVPASGLDMAGLPLGVVL